MARKYQHINQVQMQQAVLNHFHGMSQTENAAALGITARQLAYWKTTQQWGEWESAIRQEMARAAVVSHAHLR